MPFSRHHRECACCSQGIIIYHLRFEVELIVRVQCARLIYDRRGAKRGIRGRKGVCAEDSVQWAWAIILRREQEQVRAIWEILAAHDHNFHPIPVQLPVIFCPLWARTYPPCSSYGPRPPLPARRVPRQRRTFLTLSRLQQNFAAIVRRWARTVRSMSQSMSV